MRLPAFTILLALVCAHPAAAQMEGYIDLEGDVERQIEALEQMVGGDASARSQSMVLQWLIELYGSLGHDAGVARCYDRILRFFPNDVGTLNSYGRFLMDTVGDYERADSILYDAYQWGQATDTRSLDMGATQALRAELRRRTGDPGAAVRLSDRAMELLPPERSAEVLRTRALSLVELERFDDAADTWLDLIGTDRGANTEDINQLKLIVPLTRYGAAEIDERIASAIEAFQRQEQARIELEGGTVVRFASEDGVELEGTLREADGPGAVLFVHDTGGRRSAFTPYGQLLFIDGISSLAVDLRGHGGSRNDSLLDFDTLPAHHRDRLADDVVAAYRHLQQTLGLDDEHVAIVAAGRATALVELALYRGRIHAPVVHLSPTFPRAEPEVDTAVSFHPDRPVLVVCAREDLESLKAISRLKGDKQRSRLTTRMYPDAGYGLETLRRIPEALEGFQAWLRETVGSS